MKTVKAWAVMNGSHIRNFFDRSLLYVAPTRRQANRWALDSKVFSVVRVEIREVKRERRGKHERH